MRSNPQNGDRIIFCSLPTCLGSDSSAALLLQDVALDSASSWEVENLLQENIHSNVDEIMEHKVDKWKTSA